MANPAAQTADPYAGLTTPVSPSPSTASGASSDPYAGLTTPVPPAPPSKGILDNAMDLAGGIVPGAIQSAGESIQALPYVGKEIISPEAMQAEREYFRPGSAAEKAGQGIGAAGETILEFVMGDEALKSLALSAKIGLAGKITQIAKDSPYIGKLLEHGVSAARMGTVGTTEALAKGATPKHAVETGIATGVGGEVLKTAGEAVASIPRVNPFRAAANAVKAAAQGPEAAAEAASQPIAKAGVQAAAPTVGPSLRSGIDVKTPFAEAKVLYKTVDDAAKTNFQDLYSKLDAAQDDARQAASGSPEEAKAQLNVKNTQDAIDDAKKIAAHSGVPDVDKTLAQADAKYKVSQANKDFNSKFFGNQGVVKGNIAHGAPETIDVDKAITTLENMDKPNKFGVSRLQETSLGKDGALKLKQVLYDAQKAGQKAMDTRALRNTILKWGIPGVGTALGIAYEATK